MNTEKCMAQLLASIDLDLRVGCITFRFLSFATAPQPLPEKISVRADIVPKAEWPLGSNRVYRQFLTQMIKRTDEVRQPIMDGLHHSSSETL